MPIPLVLPCPTDSTRVFCGYRRVGLSDADFYKELGETFMPGTPLMLAPLGLGAYVAAVLDLGGELPDEAALVIYADRAAYDDARQNSVEGRMYTHSHAGVFDMGRSGGQFPGPVTSPSQRPNEDRLSWYLVDQPVDWQHGDTRLLFVTAGAGTNVQQATLRHTAARQPSLKALGIAQVIVVATPAYAAIWVHGAGVGAIPMEQLDLVPPDATIRRDLVAQPVIMRKGSEGPTITGAGAFSFRFVRELRFFV